jgi:hypothetical protein
MQNRFTLLSIGKWKVYNPWPLTFRYPKITIWSNVSTTGSYGIISTDAISLWSQTELPKTIKYGSSTTTKTTTQDCDQYNRFTLKVDYDHFNKRPQLILSFDRPTLVIKPVWKNLEARQRMIRLLF